MLDGWWVEGYEQDNGWAIGAGEELDDQDFQDEVEATAIYDLLENEIVPTFYERGNDDVPREWTRIMKNSMRTVNAEFNTNRMVEEYTQRFYIPALENAKRLEGDSYAKATELGTWRTLVSNAWNKVQIVSVDAAPLESQPMGTQLPVRADIQLGDFGADEILVEAYHGLLDASGQIVNGETATLFLTGEVRDGLASYEGNIACRRAGRRGFTVRVVPRKPGYPLGRFETGKVIWWEDNGQGSGSGSESAKQGTRTH